jgi:hypothetical protein
MWTKGMLRAGNGKQPELALAAGQLEIISRLVVSVLALLLLCRASIAEPGRPAALVQLPTVASSIDSLVEHCGGYMWAAMGISLLETNSLFGWLVADVWCWFVLREEYCWLVADGWFVLREKYCWLVADKPSEQAAKV